MKRFALNAILAASVFCGPVLIGCDKTVSEEKSVQRKSDGTTVTKTEKTTETPDGGIKTTSERKVDQNPNATVTETQKTTVSPDGSSRTTTEHKVSN